MAQRVLFQYGQAREYLFVRIETSAPAHQNRYQVYTGFPWKFKRIRVDDYISGSDANDTMLILENGFVVRYDSYEKTLQYIDPKSRHALSLTFIAPEKLHEHGIENLKDIENFSQYCATVLNTGGNQRTPRRF